MKDTGYRIQDTGYRIQEVGFRIQEVGCRGSRFGIRVSVESREVRSGVLAGFSAALKKIFDTESEIRLQTQSGLCSMLHSPRRRRGRGDSAEALRNLCVLCASAVNKPLES